MKIPLLTRLAPLLFTIVALAALSLVASVSASVPVSASAPDAVSASASVSGKSRNESATFHVLATRP